MIQLCCILMQEMKNGHMQSERYFEHNQILLKIQILKSHFKLLLGEEINIQVRLSAQCLWECFQSVLLSCTSYSDFLAPVDRWEEQNKQWQ